MTERAQLMGDPHPFLLAGVILVIVLIVGSQVIATIQQNRSVENELGTEVCHDEFGPEWTYSGYMGNYPPTVQCQLGEDTLGVTEMPPDMREEVGIVIPADVANRTSENGTVSLDTLPVANSTEQAQ